MKNLRTLFPILIVLLLGAACVWLVLSTGTVEEPPPLVREARPVPKAEPEPEPMDWAQDWPKETPMAEVAAEDLPEQPAVDSGKTLRGRVFTENGSPVAGASLYVDRQLADTGGPPDAVSGDGGRFELNSLPDRGFKIAAYHSEYPPGYETVAATHPPDREVRVILYHGGAVEGRVTLGGKGLDGAQVTLGPVGGQYRKIETDARGAYRMAGIAPGQYDIIARYKAGVGGAERHTSRRVHVELNTTTKLDFEIPGGSSGIRGRITVDGELVTRSRINGVVTVRSGEREVFNLDIDGGEYELTDLPTGQLIFNIHVLEYEGQHVNELSPYAGNTNNLRRNSTVDLPPGQIVERDFEFFPSVGVRGTAEGLGPDERASVLVLEGYREFDDWNMDSFLVVAAQKVRSQRIGDNTFIVNDLPPRDYTVLAYVEPHDVTGDPNEVLSNLRMQLIYVELAPGQMQDLHFDLR